MSIGDRINKIGFKRWYERSLLEGHAYLVTSFLGLILMLAALEMASSRTDALQLLFGLVGGLAGVTMTVFGTRRYFHMLRLTGEMCQHATCSQCSTYAAFNVLASGYSRAGDPDDLDYLWFKVKCRKCGYEWRF